MVSGICGHDVDDYTRLDTAEKELEAAISKIRNLGWADLCALDDEGRQKITVLQQEAHECYAKLKRVLLETHKAMFESIKKDL